MKDLYHLLLRKIAHFQTTHPYYTILIIIALTVMMVGAASNVRTVASLEQMMPQDVEEIKAFNVLRDNHMGQDILAVVVQLDREATDPNSIQDVRDKRVHDYVAYISSMIEKEPDVLNTHSYVDVTERFSSANMSKEEYNQLMQNEQVQGMLSNYVNEDSSTTLILATTDVSADDERMKLLSQKIKDDIDSAGHPPGIEITYTGTPVIQQRLGELISADRTNTQWISTLFVFLLTMFIFGTFTSAVVPILIVTISVNWLYGTMGYTNLPISTLAGGVAAMVIGIGIDFAIHIMNKFKYERRKGYSIAVAVERAIVETGTALTATSVTTISAFLAFLVGQMPEMGRFGMLMAIGIGYALVFSLFGLPALLILEEKLIYWLRTRVRFGVEGEFTLRTNEDKCD